MTSKKQQDPEQGENSALLPSREFPPLVSSVDDLIPD